MENNSQPSIFNNPDNNNSNLNSENVVNNNKVSTQVLNLGKVFLYMFLGILLTGVVCTLTAWLINFYSPLSDGVVIALSSISIFAGIGTLVCSFLAGSLTLRSKPKSFSVAIPFALYAIFVGYLLGMIAFALPWQVFATTFGLTALIYGILALVGLLVKSNLNPLIYVASTLLGGALLLALINFIMMIFLPEIATILYWIVSFVIFGALMLTTIWDVWNIKKISAGYELTRNMSLYCAFRLYCDFIAIFVRLLYIVLLLAARNRN